MTNEKNNMRANIFRAIAAYHNRNLTELAREWGVARNSINVNLKDPAVCPNVGNQVDQLIGSEIDAMIRVLQDYRKKNC